jgi:hypothetical protein
MTTLSTTSVRAGDSERDSVARKLGQALVQGYLDMAEYEDRVGKAFAANTTAELRPLLADLPIGRLRRDDPARHASRRAAARTSVRVHLAAYLAMVVIVVTVWLAVAVNTGAWYFWPVWPILGAGIGVLGHAVPIRLACGRHT